MKPKCLSEAGLPKHWYPRNSFGTPRSAYGEGMGYVERLLAESLFLCITRNVSFPTENNRIQSEILFAGTLKKVIAHRKFDKPTTKRETGRICPFFARNLVELLIVCLQSGCQSRTQRKTATFSSFKKIERPGCSFEEGGGLRKIYESVYFVPALA